MTLILKFLVETVRVMVGNARTVVLGLGLAGTAILVLETWEQVSAHLYYQEVEATVIALERGCIADGADRDRVNPVLKCEKKEGAKAEPFQKPYVTFEFPLPDGKMVSFQRQAGEVGAPTDAFAGQHFRLMYDPASPHSMTAPLGEAYITRVLPVGIGGGLLIWLYFGSRRFFRS